MDEHSDEDLTHLISRMRAGDVRARDVLFTLVYDELLRLARSQRFVGRDGETLQPTALANEAYLLFTRRLPTPPRHQAEDRRVFFRTVGLAMREILRDYWRGQVTLKRGGKASPISLENDAELGSGCSPRGADLERDRAEFLALDAALNALETFNTRWHEVVLHRYFAGRSIEETAALLGVSETTVKADWQFARVWLRRAIDGGGRDRSVPRDSRATGGSSARVSWTNDAGTNGECERDAADAPPSPELDVPVDGQIPGA